MESIDANEHLSDKQKIHKVKAKLNGSGYDAYIMQAEDSRDEDTWEGLIAAWNHSSDLQKLELCKHPSYLLILSFASFSPCVLW